MDATWSHPVIFWDCWASNKTLHAQSSSGVLLGNSSSKRVWRLARVDVVTFAGLSAMFMVQWIMALMLSSVRALWLFLVGFDGILAKEPEVPERGLVAHPHKGA